MKWNEMHVTGNGRLSQFAYDYIFLLRSSFTLGEDFFKFWKGQPSHIRTVYAHRKESDLHFLSLDVCQVSKNLHRTFTEILF